MISVRPEQMSSNNLNVSPADVTVTDADLRNFLWADENEGPTNPDTSADSVDGQTTGQEGKADVTGVELDHSKSPEPSSRAPSPAHSIGDNEGQTTGQADQEENEQAGQGQNPLAASSDEREAQTTLNQATLHDQQEAAGEQETANQAQLNQPGEGGNGQNPDTETLGQGEEGTGPEESESGSESLQEDQQEEHRLTRAITPQVLTRWERVELMRMTLECMDNMAQNKQTWTSPIQGKVICVKCDEFTTQETISEGLTLWIRDHRDTDMDVTTPLNVHERFIYNALMYHATANITGASTFVQFGTYFQLKNDGFRTLDSPQIQAWIRTIILEARDLIKQDPVPPYLTNAEMEHYNHYIEFFNQSRVSKEKWFKVMSDQNLLLKLNHGELPTDAQIRDYAKCAVLVQSRLDSPFAYKHQTALLQPPQVPPTPQNPPYPVARRASPPLSPEARPKPRKQPDAVNPDPALAVKPAAEPSARASTPQPHPSAQTAVQQPEPERQNNQPALEQGEIPTQDKERPELQGATLHLELGNH